MIKVDEGQWFYLRSNRKEIFDIVKIHYNFATQKYELRVKK